MSATETTSQPGDSSGRKAFVVTISKKVAGLAALWASIQFLLFPFIDVLPIEQTTRQHLESYLQIAFLIIAILVWIQPVVDLVQRNLIRASPWFVLLLVLLSGATLYMVRLLRTKPPQPTPPSVTVTFDLAHGQIFNSWQDKYASQIRRIRAWGTMHDQALWDIHSNQHGQGGPSDEAAFSYEVDSTLRPSDGSSSGGFQTFYDTPADSRVFSKIDFSLHSAETCGIGKADVGVRLTVDNPLDGTEYFTYQVNSLKAKKGTIGGWKTFELHVDEFDRVPRVRNSAPLPQGLNEHTINKVVFFIDDAIAKQCPKNTLTVRDVKFLP